MNKKFFENNPLDDLIIRNKGRKYVVETYLYNTVVLTDQAKANNTFEYVY